MSTEPKKKVATGGVAKESLDREGVIPVVFSDEPFNDASFQLHIIDKMIREDEVSDLFIIVKTKEGLVKYIWRGDNTLTSILGSLEFVKILLQRDFVDNL